MMFGWLLVHGRQKCGVILAMKRVNVGDVMNID